MKLTQNLLIAACLAAGSMTIAPQIASAMPIAPSAQSQADNGLVQQARRLCPYGMHRSPYGCIRDRYYGYGYRSRGYGGWHDRYYGYGYRSRGYGGWGDEGGWGYRPRQYYRPSPFSNLFE